MVTTTRGALGGVERDTLTVTEAAERIGCHPETIRRWIASGRIHAIKPGGAKLGWRISPAEIDRLLRAA